MDERLKRAIRRSFERAAPTYEAAAFLQQEVARRLDDHLDGVRIEPGLILDAGCGTGFAYDLLRARFPEARVVGLDIAHAMLRQARARHGMPNGWRGLLARLAPHAPPLAPLCADLEQIGRASCRERV